MTEEKALTRNRSIAGGPLTQRPDRNRDLTVRAFTSTIRQDQRVTAHHPQALLVWQFGTGSELA